MNDVYRALAGRAMIWAPTAPPGAPYPLAPWAVGSAALAPLAVTLGWLVAGTLQPRDYSPWRQTVSVMSGYAGADRWVMTAAMLLVALCYLAMTVGIRPLPLRARAGLLVSALAGLGIAVFPQPAHGSTVAHMFCTSVGEVALATWPGLLTFGRSSVRALGRRVSLIVSVAFLLLMVWLVIEVRVGPNLGFAERLSCSVQTCWPLVVVLALRRTRSRVAAVEAPSASARASRPRSRMTIAPSGFRPGPARGPAAHRPAPLPPGAHRDRSRAS
ncbi:MAG: hypothetical protein JWO63_2575 [Frankiales bacterium]|nr:hypothetical protein [Frankiales bacterium]